MTFLRLLSSTVRQQITYHCKNSMAFDGKLKSINLIGENEVDIHMNSPRKYRPTLIEDGCKVCILSSAFLMFMRISVTCFVTICGTSVLINYKSDGIKRLLPEFCRR